MRKFDVYLSIYIVMERSIVRIRVMRNCVVIIFIKLNKTYLPMLLIPATPYSLFVPRHALLPHGKVDLQAVQVQC